jgi:hypothetical protein
LLTRVSTKRGSGGKGRKIGDKPDRPPSRRRGSLCEAAIPPRSPSCLPASVVLRLMSHLSSTSPPVRGSSAQGLARYLTFAHPVVTYIQYEYYYSIEER